MLHKIYIFVCTCFRCAYATKSILGDDFFAAILTTYFVLTEKYLVTTELLVGGISSSHLSCCANQQHSL